jgi:hypothetical protein
VFVFDMAICAKLCQMASEGVSIVLEAMVVLMVICLDFCTRRSKKQY